MRRFQRFMTLSVAGIGALMLANTAIAAPPGPDELKCQLAVGGKILGKFVGAKAKCVAKCQKATPGDASCDPSYSGETATCVATAEQKAKDAIVKKCVGDVDHDRCPECYNGGDCTAGPGGYATTQVNSTEGQVDPFVTLINCNFGTNTEDQQKCQVAVAKYLSKHVAKVAKGAAKCVKKNGNGPACTPPSPTDPDTAAKLAKTKAKTAAAIDKKCGGTGTTDPRCGATPCPNNPSCWTAPFEQNGTSWTNFTQTAVDSNYNGIYCSEP